jgi:hypothetical protein
MSLLSLPIFLLSLLLYRWVGGYSWNDSLRSWFATADCPCVTILRTGVRVRVRKPNAMELRTESENLSQRGVFFAIDLALGKGTALDLLVEIPEAVTGMPTAQWLCTGHVVRVVPVGSPRGAHGVGVQFDFYEVSRPERPHWAMGVGLRGPISPATPTVSAHCRTRIDRPAERTNLVKPSSKKSQAGQVLANDQALHPRRFVTCLLGVKSYGAYCAGATFAADHRRSW